MTVRVEPLTGDRLSAALDDVARLRIRVFRDWPYLYDGDFDYERRYLATYRDSPGAILVGAFDDDTLVGASTGTPMEDHAAEFSDALRHTGLALETVFYCAESVLLPEYRGRGIGNAFFDHREAHARALGRTHAAFCSVVRPDNHTARPTDYVPLDRFWMKRGYEKIPGAFAEFSWKDLDEPGETKKPLQFWMRRL